MSKTANLSETLMLKLKNNPIVAIVIVVGSIIIAIASFTKALQNISNFIGIGKSQTAQVSGKWSSGVLTDQYDNKNTYKFTFEFNVSGKTLIGSRSRVSTQNAYNLTKGIMEGKIDGNSISFSITENSWVGKEKVSYKNYFYGSVDKDQIEFTLQSDRPWNFVPQKFVATRM